MLAVKCRVVEHVDWLMEGRKRFGDDMMSWKFVCPSCGYVISVRDWYDLEAPEGAIAFSCIGRFLRDGDEQSKAYMRTFHHRGGPCGYAGGGLIKLNPVVIVFPDGNRIGVFEFADGN